MITLTPHQENALRTVVDNIRDGNPLTYLAGVAGTGKSTILAFILESLGYPPDTVAFCAPTGKAVKVMRTKLKAQRYPNPNTSTIHSLIYRARPAPISTLEDDIASHEVSLAELINRIQAEADGQPINLNLNHDVVKLRKDVARLKEELSQAYREDKINFNLNVDSCASMASLIVVDEASMVGRQMADDLMYFGVPILAIGDPAQLPPVEDAAGLTAGDPDFFLTEIHRQAFDNPIIWLSMLAREGKDLPLGKHGDTVEVIERYKFDTIYSDLATRPQFLVGTNKTRWAVNQTLRQDFGFVDRAGDVVGPRVGEPLIVKRNMREYPNLVNGTECTALSNMDIPNGQACLLGSFEDDEGTEYRNKMIYQGLFEEHFTKRPGGFTAVERTAYRAKKKSINLDWGLCFTSHAAQGSSWRDVVVIDESSVFRKDANRWLYTSITRAEETLKVLRND